MSMSLLSTWWLMVNSQANIDGTPIPDDQIVLNFMSGGASCFLTKKDLDNAIAEHQLNEDKIKGWRSDSGNC